MATSGLSVWNPQSIASIFLTALNPLSAIAFTIVLFVSLTGLSKAANFGDQFPPVRIIDKLENYPVVGRSVREINSALILHARQSENAGNGSTRSRFEIDRTHLRHEGRCELDSLQVRVVIVTTLPRWQSEARSPAPVRQQWRQSTDILQRHEAGHREHALAEAIRLRKNVLGIGSKNSCLSLDAAIDLELQSSMQHLDLKDLRYDDRTWNGLRDDPLTLPATSIATDAEKFRWPHGVEW